MAVTKGHGNPNWSRDETLLALELLLRLNGVLPSANDPRVQKLSAELRALPIHPQERRGERFRNPDGVAFKLQNLRAVSTGRGLLNVSSMDKTLVAELAHDAALVFQLAQAIRSRVSAGDVSETEVMNLSADEEFLEGRILTVSHKLRERSPKLRSRLLEQRELKSRLRCDCCEDGPKSSDPNLQFAGFEAHHIVPLAHLTTVSSTRVSDLALLCATCHRLMHRFIQLERRWITVAELSARLQAPHGLGQATESSKF
ncbi:MAG: HNH endonuclease [Alphaproteobacteria bacterium]|nr:MAG: HNH endonuclease [Alphaproteobacteria bacterium]